MSVYLKLNKARKMFHKKELKKSGHNKFAGYQYFELADFVVPALEVFDECGLCAVVSFSKEEASMTVVDTDSGDSIRITSPMAELQLKGCHPIQNMGAIETYQRRYLWMAALEIVEHDAVDSSKPISDEEAYNALVDQCIDVITVVKESIASGDLSSGVEAWYELDTETQGLLWKAPNKGGCFTTKERQIMKDEFAKIKRGEK
jgi:hypothetical protein